MRRGLTLVEVAAALALLSVLVLATLPILTDVGRAAADAPETSSAHRSPTETELDGSRILGTVRTEEGSSWVEWDLDGWPEDRP